MCVIVVVCFVCIQVETDDVSEGWDKKNGWTYSYIYCTTKHIYYEREVYEVCELSSHFYEFISDWRVS